MNKTEKIYDAQIEFTAHKINSDEVEELAERLLKSFEEKNTDATD